MESSVYTVTKSFIRMLTVQRIVLDGLTDLCRLTLLVELPVLERTSEAFPDFKTGMTPHRVMHESDLDPDEITAQRDILDKQNKKS